MLRIPEMKTFSYSRSLGAALIGIAAIAPSYTVSLAMVGAASALPWVSATFESERSLRTVPLDLLKLKVELLAKYAETGRLSGVSL
jgi:hypothetical protein